MNVREAFHQWLKNREVKMIFGNPGSTELPFLVEWPSDVQYVLGLQESIVVAMADGYAQASGCPAFVNLHAAQGLGNAIGAFRTARYNHSPMVVIVGQEDIRHHILEPLLYGDMTSLGKPVVKWAYEVKDSSEVVPAIERAFHLASLPPQGPVLLSVPMNLWDGPAKLVPTREVSTNFAPTQLAGLADALTNAAHPAIVVGAGAACSGAWEATMTLAERLQCPVFGAPLSSRMGFPNWHPLYAGMLQPVLPLIFQTLTRFDVVAVIGAPAFLTYPYLPGPQSLPKTRIYQVTDVPDDLAASLADFGYLGSIKESITQLLKAIPLRNPKPLSLSAARRAQRKSAAMRSRNQMGVPFVLDVLANHILNGTTTIVDEAASASPLVREYLPISQPSHYFTAATGGLGWGLPAAAGVALARPESPVLAVIGDGSSLYGIQALWTMAQHHLPVGIIILNNGQYGILENLGKMLYPGRETTIPGLRLPGVSLVDIAHGFGIFATSVKRPENLERELAEHWQNNAPFLLDITVEKENLSLFI